ncbi:MAG: flavodoxin-dependent (E)-4-hydroxy-3-methylbut-2-enyl-diphosphate synthase, partial [Oscillospiraceae bacterium]|nr:flavodoxin-dependent (E)-4-hydroxy-3-methylbut-2-enyl-diphosphate synthase [Oscillospiraceae bacterium]
ILKACGIGSGVEIVSCPTCGRTKIDLITLANQVEDMLKDVDKPLKVAVMGCVVNGPGEAREADIGVAGGIGEGIIFRKGEILRKVPEDRILEELKKEIDLL